MNEKNLKSWNEFASSTTFHGIKNIFDKKNSYLRRLVWIIIMFMVLGLFGFQVVSRGLDFGRRELTSSIEIVYSKKLSFPTITLCNQNMFR